MANSFSIPQWIFRVPSEIVSRWRRISNRWQEKRGSQATKLVGSRFKTPIKCVRYAVIVTYFIVISVEVWVCRGIQRKIRIDFIFHISLHVNEHIVNIICATKIVWNGWAGMGVNRNSNISWIFRNFVFIQSAFKMSSKCAWKT